MALSRKPSLPLPRTDFCGRKRGAAGSSPMPGRASHAASFSTASRCSGVVHSLLPLPVMLRTRCSPLVRGRKTWSVIETALPRLFELRSFSLVGIALVPPKRWAHASIHVPLQTLVLRQQGRSNLQNRLGVLQQPRLLGPLDPVVELFDQGVIRCRFIFSEA